MPKTKQPGMSRGGIFLLSLLGLLVSIATIAMLITIRPEPDKVPTVELPPPQVRVTTVARGVQPIRVRVYGTARAAEQVVLRAPFAGTVIASPIAVAGMVTAASETLFTLETTKLDLQSAQITAQIEELGIRRQRLNSDIEILEGRIQTQEALLDLAVQSEATQQDARDIEGALLDRRQQLFEREALSEFEFLQAQETYKQAELTAIEASKAVEVATDTLLSLQQPLETAKHDLEALEHEIARLQLQKAEITDDVAKANIKVDFPSHIVSVDVDQREEVVAGAALATVRSRDLVYIDVTLPDTHFSWLYGSDSILETVRPDGVRGNIDLSLINQQFPKVFHSAFLRAVGSSVLSPTRSLPMTLARRNPVDDNGNPHPSDELRPGMYVAAMLTLAKVENTFIVPSTAIQDNGGIYHVVNGALEMIDHVEIIYEGPDGVIVRLPVDYARIEIVAHLVQYGRAGMKVVPVPSAPDEVLAPITLLAL